MSKQRQLSGKLLQNQSQKLGKSSRNGCPVVETAAAIGETITESVTEIEEKAARNY
ncbi:MAG UNVERIFIED_CONTAM: hypothetical protein LVR29_15140 [Microcystis novacekii LVE1205-3]